MSKIIKKIYQNIFRKKTSNYRYGGLMYNRIIFDEIKITRESPEYVIEVNGYGEENE